MAIKPSEFGIIVTGMMTASQETKKGKHMISVSLGNSMVKIICEENGLQFGQIYRGQCSPLGDGLFYEQKRLSQPAEKVAA